MLGSLEELLAEFEAERVAILKSLEGLSAESVADLVEVGLLHSTEDLLVESEVDLGTFALLGLPGMLLAEFEVEAARVASVRSLEELVALLGSLGPDLQLQAAAPAVATVRSELLEATLEVDLAGLVAEQAAVVVEPHPRLAAAGVELVLGFVAGLSGLVRLVV